MAITWEMDGAENGSGSIWIIYFFLFLFFVWGHEKRLWTKLPSLTWKVCNRHLILFFLHSYTPSWLQHACMWSWSSSSQISLCFGKIRRCFKLNLLVSRPNQHAHICWLFGYHYTDNTFKGSIVWNNLQ